MLKKEQLSKKKIPLNKAKYQVILIFVKELSINF